MPDFFFVEKVEHLSFIFRPYNPQYYFWEVCECGRRLVLGAVPTGVPFFGRRPRTLRVFAAAPPRPAATDYPRPACGAAATRLDGISPHRY